MVETPAWAAHPKYLWWRGRQVEVHYIGALAAAVGKSPWTIRRWERLGVMPETPLAAAVDGGKGLRRLYLRQQIEGVQRIAEDERVAGRKPADIASTHFTARVQELYLAIFPNQSSAE